MSVTAIAKPDAKGAQAETDGAEAPKKSKKKLVIIAVVLLAVLGGGAYEFLVPKPPSPPKPGAVLTLDPIQINLAGEHYLRIGVALQLTKTAPKDVDGSKALDATINEFSGTQVGDLGNPVKRRAMKAQLEKVLGEIYDREVMDVYFTEFVTQ